MTTRRGTLPPGSGLHARPAADLVAAIVASGRPVRVARPDKRSVDGRSVLRVLALGILGTQEVELSVLEDDGHAEADAALLDQLLELLGAAGQVTAVADGRVLVGISASPGAAAGAVERMADRAAARPAEPSDDPAGAQRRALDALAAVARDFRTRIEKRPPSARAVLEAGAAIASDPALHEEVARLTRAGRSSTEALAEAVEPFRAAIADAGGDLGQRVADIDDVRDRAIAICLGLPLPGLPDRTDPYVLVADDLAPADAALLDPAVVLAIVTVGGGPTGHTAILAREFGIPAVVACPGASGLRSGQQVAVFATEGTVVVSPDEERLAGVRARRTTVSPVGAAGTTADGHRVAILANVGSPDRAEAARAAGAEGVGLLRTEFCFEGRGAAPTVEEQVAAYGRVARAFAGTRVVIRLLDAGADKPLPYVRGAVEDNPALGVRGLRALREADDVLTDQLAAIAGVAAAGEAEIWAMAPMVATAAEARWFAERARAAGISKVGVMIEIPAAALAAADLLARVDFASIGTNDLAQYTFAADRGIASLAELQSPWQPALLRLVEMTAGAGGQTGRPVGVCGEAAGDAALAVVLVGLGVTSLSMAAGSIAAVRAQLAVATLDECRRLAQVALAAGTAQAARDAVGAALGR
jgi:phosphotransferase system enzyme I (PtsI)